MDRECHIEGPGCALPFGSSHTHSLHCSDPRRILYMAAIMRRHCAATAVVLCVLWAVHTRPVYGDAQVQDDNFLETEIARLDLDIELVPDGAYATLPPDRVQTYRPDWLARWPVDGLNTILRRWTYAPWAMHEVEDALPDVIEVESQDELNAMPSAVKRQCTGIRLQNLEDETAPLLTVRRSDAKLYTIERTRFIGTSSFTSWEAHPTDDDYLRDLIHNPRVSAVWHSTHDSAVYQRDSVAYKMQRREGHAPCEFSPTLPAFEANWFIEFPNFWQHMRKHLSQELAIPSHELMVNLAMAPKDIVRHPFTIHRGKGYAHLTEDKCEGNTLTGIQQAFFREATPTPVVEAYALEPPNRDTELNHITLELGGHQWVGSLFIASRAPHMDSTFIEAILACPQPWMHNTCSDSTFDDMDGAQPLVYPVRPRLVPVHYLEGVPPRRFATNPISDPGHDPTASAYVSIFNWYVVPSARPYIPYHVPYEGVTIRSAMGLVGGCKCTFPTWTWGPACQYLYCDDDWTTLDDIPPGQFWQQCPATFKKICHYNQATRAPCGPNYHNATAFVEWDATFNIWRCVCKGDVWDQNPLAVGFALQSPVSADGLLADPVPPCLDANCTRLAYCSDHVDAEAGFDPDTGAPRAWTNLLPPYNTSHTMCNGHGTCRGSVLQMDQQPGAQTAGWCTCADPYMGPGCTQCKPPAWGWSFGCTRSCLSTRGLTCHNKGTCDSFEGCVCVPTSNRDPATNCQTCLPNHFIDKTTCPLDADGEPDMDSPVCRCVPGSSCIDPVTTNICAGHGECIVTPFNNDRPNECLCQSAWRGEVCNEFAPGCEQRDPTRPCTDVQSSRRCANDRVFLLPDPNARVSDVWASMSPEARQALLDAGIASRLDTQTTASVLAAWPNDPRWNSLVCTALSDWTGTAAATITNWEDASQHSRKDVVRALMRAPHVANRTHWLPNAGIPGAWDPFVALDTGEPTLFLPANDLGSSHASFTGPSLCLRNSCQIDTAACVPFAASTTCVTTDTNIVVVPVHSDNVTAEVARATCASVGRIPLRKDDLMEPGTNIPQQLESMTRASIDGRFGTGTYTRANLQLHAFPGFGPMYMTRQHLFVWLADAFDSANRPVSYGVYRLRNYAFDLPYALDTPATSYYGWTVIPCSPDCASHTLYGPDPDCNRVM